MFKYFEPSKIFSVTSRAPKYVLLLFVIILTIGLIMSLEGLNTAIEEIADFIHPEHHKKIGLIKDLAAGASDTGLSLLV